MKQLVAILCLVSILTASKCTGSSGREKSAETVSDTGTAELVFLEYDHDFGKVPEGEKISWQFIFENNGTGNLVLNAVSTTCGCTVPRYDKKPVAPGGKGSIEVLFDTSGRSGKQTKIITVMSNSTRPVTMLRITAEVVQE